MMLMSSQIPWSVITHGGIRGWSWESIKYDILRCVRKVAALHAFFFWVPFEFLKFECVREKTVL